MVIAYVDRTALSVVIAVPDFRAYFGLTDSQRGLMNSAFFWTYALLQVPAGWMVDRFGVRYPYAISFVFWSIVSALTGATQTVAQLFTVRLLLGVGEATVAPASLRWIRMNIEEKQRGLAMGIYMAGTKFGPAVGAPIAAFLIAVYGWRSMFYLTGLVSLAWLIPWLLLVPNDKPVTRAGQAGKQPEAPFRAVFRSPAIWGILIGTFCYSCYLYFCITWLPAYFKEQRKLPLDMMGLYTMFSFGGMAITTILFGWIADRLISRGGDPIKVRRAFTITGLLIAATEVFGAAATSPGVALFFAMFSLAGLGIATANYWALTQTVVPGTAIGRIGGLQNMASNLAGVAAPILTGILIEKTGTYEAPMQAIAVLLVIGAISYALLVRPAADAR
ncbi:MAG TPA: MFS transporter [Bryobacteraceae bacterium]|nr:MFS transporter [Bryobacteraceae bacterium]